MTIKAPKNRPTLPVPTTSNEKILDAYIRHQTYLLRYVGGLRNEMATTLNATEETLSNVIFEHLQEVPNRTLTGAAGRKWVSEFEAAVRNIRYSAWSEVNREVQDQLKELVVQEALTASIVMENAVPVVLNMTLPPTSQLISIVNSQPFEGRTLKEWMTRTSQADVNKILTLAKTGIIQGRTPLEIATSVTGTKKFARRDAATRKAIHDLESVLLTVVNGIQQEAKQKLYEENSDIVKEELYIAVLDVRTTLECASNDRKKFPRGEGPIPPLHFRCRSLRTPYLNPEFIGDRGFDPTTEKQLLQEYADSANITAVNKRGSLPYGHKTKFDAFARTRSREMIGQVPGLTTYNDWLKVQSTQFQDQVLGKTRAKLFRKGDIHLDKFVARDGDTYTLAELKELGINVPKLN